MQALNESRGSRRTTIATALLLIALSAIFTKPASALIQGSTGNSPLTDPGWPDGAAAIVNNPARIACWEGPPFGGGQSHAEFRGDAKTLNAILQDFAKLDVKRKQVVVHDGVGHSFWLNPNREPAKEESARMDWVFMVWQSKSWEQLRKLPVGLKSADLQDSEPDPPSRIDIYTGGNLKWPDIRIPAGIDVDDQRLEAHGFKLEDQNGLEGTIVDLSTKKPLAGKIILQQVTAQPKGDREFSPAVEASADEHGHWTLKKTPPGWYRMIAQAEGYVPRVVSWVGLDDQLYYQAYKSALTRSGPVAGRVTDDAGNPLADVKVRLDNVAAEGEQSYETPDGYACQTDKDGRFHLDQVPIGKATVYLHKTGYCRPGVGESIATPTADVSLSMIKSADVVVTVAFPNNARDASYIVELIPEGGEKAGVWSGSGNVDANNQISFKDAFPGRYYVSGHPNPTTDKERTAPIVMDLEGGKKTEITIGAK